MLTKRRNYRSAKTKNATGILKEMLGPVSNQEENNKIKLLLGLRSFSDEAEFRKMSNFEDTTIAELTTNNSKEASKTLPEVVESLTNGEGKFCLILDSRMSAGKSAFNRVNLLPSREGLMDYFYSHCNDELEFTSLNSAPHFPHMSNLYLNSSNEKQTYGNRNGTNSQNFYKSKLEQNKPLFAAVKSPKEERNHFKTKKENINFSSNLAFGKKLLEKDDYLAFLINAAESLVQKGFTSLAEMNTSPEEEDSLRQCDNPICSALGSKKSKTWVKVGCKVQGKPSYLCSTCHAAWLNNQFCFYCRVIYTDNSGSSNYNDNKNWVMCDFCEMWQHIQCEEEQGFYKDLTFLLEDSEFKYKCPHCRHKTEDNSDNLLLKKKRKAKEKKIKHLDYSLLKNESHSVYDKHNVDSRDIYHDFYKIANINEKK